MVKDRPPVALIAGPTASGKSELALRLAENSHGVVINADSAQIYRDLPILSAAPSTADMARAEHRLYGERDGANPCSAADWARLAKDVIFEVADAGKLPIIVGGTGLYIRSLIDGIAPIPPIDPEIRGDVRSASVAENYAALFSLDPVAAQRLNPGDTTRVARALEVVKSTGHPLSYWHTRMEGGIKDQINLRPFLLVPPRPWLISRCDQRFEAMFHGGAMEEVRALCARNLNPELPVMRSIGVAEIGGYLDGELSEVQAIAAGQLATRQYAKRQYTWFSNQPPEKWPRFPDPLTDANMADALALLQPTR